VTDREAFIGLRLHGRYRLEQPLARGGVCTVYRGVDETLNRRVAVKAVPPEHVEAYRAALHATSALSHPAIVVLWDAVPHEGWLFLIHEYVDGMPLAGKIATGLSQAQALNMALQLSCVLAYAHKHEVRHGDLTPAAVLVERDGAIRLNNFALGPDDAYFVTFAETESMLARGLNGEAHSQELVPSGPGAAGEPDPFADDIRAVGLLLWQTLASASPTGGRRDFRADVPADLRHVVARAVVRSHPERLTTAEEAIAALEELARNVPDVAAEEEEQPTPSAIHAARAAMGWGPAWSTQDTVASGGPWSTAWPPPAAPDPSASPRKTRYLGEPDGDPPMRPGTPSGPLRAPVPSGPLRAPVPSGPLRAPGPSGPLRGYAAPSQPGQIHRPTAQPLPYGSPHGTPTSAPAIPWRDEPALARWAASPPYSPGARAGLPRESRRLGVLPVVAIGVVLFIVCFVVGYLMPLIIPLR
jgi:serine/threonine protein kinase